MEATYKDEVCREVEHGNHSRYAHCLRVLGCLVGQGRHGLGLRQVDVSKLRELSTVLTLDFLTAEQDDIVRLLIHRVSNTINGPEEEGGGVSTICLISSDEDRSTCTVRR